MENLDEKFVIAIANEINGIIASAGAVSMSWGITDKAATIYNGMAAFAFRVDGFQHKGGVIVALNEGKDLYECYFMGKDGEVVKAFEDVFIDELVGLLDREIETGEDDEKTYSAKVNKWFGETIN